MASDMTIEHHRRQSAEGAVPIRVMVVDDSAVVRGLVTRQLEADPSIAVVARAANGRAALMELDRIQVDVIVLDLEMPVMDGMTALPLLLARQPGVQVIIASTLTLRNARIGMQALQAGAADYLSKPDGGSLLNADAFNRDLIAKVRALGVRADANVAAPVGRVESPTVRRPSRAVRPEVIVIGGSTGAPPALMQIFQALRNGPDQPILIAQHMPPIFTAMLAEQLARAGARDCAEAVDGEPVRPGRAYVAPGGWHMTVVRDRNSAVIRLNQDPPEHFCRPAVDPLLRSVAEVYGPASATVILTGMGSDGALGCQALAKVGGRFVVQDEASSAVWGMPGAAARTGLCEAILPLTEIGPWLRGAAA
jgi:two-component system chemotaxis response regulator CheB